MTKTTKNRAIAAITLLIGAGLAWQWSEHILHRYRWVVLEQPIRLEDGFSMSYAFTVDVAAKYSIEVACRKTVPIDILRETLAKRLGAQFAVIAGTNQIAAGDTTRVLGMRFAAEDVSREIATFDAVPGTPYNLTLRITADLPELSSTRPPVKVSVERVVFKGFFVSASLFAYLALGLAFAALVYLGQVIWSLLFRRSNENHRNA